MATRELTDGTFEQTVKGDGIVLVDFWELDMDDVRAKVTTANAGPPRVGPA